jgi:hypothetical protein
MNVTPRDTRLGCLYRRSWEDGFGARGWKLARALDDPEVIAATAATGERIPTSVLIHDILDHAFCGLGTSGHRTEAIALLQLAERTGADPMPDFAQMVDEDLLMGRAVGESFRDLLPPDLSAQIPDTMRNGQTIAAHLRTVMGPDALRQQLIQRLFELGQAGAPRAREAYARHGLDYSRRGPLGLALQGLLVRADELVRARDWASATAEIWVDPRRCGFEITAPASWSGTASYQQTRAGRTGFTVSSIPGNLPLV